MIDPIAIVELTEENSVETGDNQVENVSQIAVWDWYQRSPDGETAFYELNTNQGDYYVDVDDVDEINEIN